MPGGVSSNTKDALIALKKEKKGGGETSQSCTLIEVVSHKQFHLFFLGLAVWWTKSGLENIVLLWLHFLK